MVECYSLIPDSGGAGKHRGGLGLERVTRARAPMTFGSQIERAHCKPWGLAGGGEATGNEVALQINGQWKEDFPNAKVLIAPIKPGESFRLRSGGGGGYGPAWERDLAAVQNDVKQGYVSVAAAAELYGVVVDPVTFAVDRTASDARRAALRTEAAKERVSPSA